MFDLIGKMARSFGEFKGKRRLTRMLLAPYKQTKKDIAIKGSYNCSYLLPNIKEPVAYDLFIDGIYEEETHAFLLKVLPQNAVYFDIGANIGSIAIPLCKKRPDVKCVAVEASEWVFGYLSENVKRNNLQTSIAVVNEAIGDTAEGFVSFYTSQDFFGKGSMSPVFSNQPIQVKRTTFMDLMGRFKVQNIDVIKIDIEGFEYFAFKGGEQILSSEEAPLILFEFVHWAEEHAGLKPGDAQRLLQSYGYSLYELMNNGSFKKLSGAVNQGSAMLVATKNEQRLFK